MGPMSTGEWRALRENLTKFLQNNKNVKTKVTQFQNSVR